MTRTARMPTAHVVCAEPDCSNPNPDGSLGVVSHHRDRAGHSGLRIFVRSGCGDPGRDSIRPDSPRRHGSHRYGDAVSPIRHGGHLRLRVHVGSGGGHRRCGVTATTVASATATVDVGAVTGITNLVGGSGYITPGGIKKFQDGLPVLCDPARPDLGELHRQQPGPAHPDRGARHHDLLEPMGSPRRGLLRDRRRPAPRADELISACHGNAAARVRAARDPGERRLEQARRAARTTCSTAPPSRP